MIRRKRANNNLVQVSTYLPEVKKLQLQTLAEAQGITQYALMKKVIEDFLDKAEKRGMIKAADDSELLG